MRHDLHVQHMIDFRCVHLLQKAFMNGMIEQRLMSAALAWDHTLRVEPLPAGQPTSTRRTLLGRSCSAMASSRRIMLPIA